MYLICVISKTFKMIILELCMFSYNFAYMIMSDFCIRRIKTNPLIINHKGKLQNPFELVSISF